jgi:hypothetical protein
MTKRILVFLAVSLALFVIPSWAQDIVPCSGEGSVITCSFSSAQATNSYEFFNDGRLTVQFDTVLTMFDLTVTVVHVTDSQIVLDGKEFPAGTVCVKYAFNGTQCDRYDFSGTAVPGGLPVKNKDYKGLITLTLSYDTSQTVHNPAFGHAPGDIATFTEDILTSYSVVGPPPDPTMGGKVPGLSSLIALDEPLTENDTSCFVFVPAPQENNSSNEKPVFEVAFQLRSGTGCSGAPIRDKTARLTVSTTDTDGNVTFPPLMNGGEGNKFHWDSKSGLNEYDISTEGLEDGKYTVTVFSSKFSPQNTTFCLLSGAAVACP